MSHSPYSNKKVMEDWLKDLGVLDTLATAAKIIQLAANTTLNMHGTPARA